MSFSKFTTVFSRVVAPLFGHLSAGFADAQGVGVRRSHQEAHLLRGGLGQGIAPVGRFIKLALWVFLALTPSAERAFAFSGSSTQFPRHYIGPNCYVEKTFDPSSQCSVRLVFGNTTRDSGGTYLKLFSGFLSAWSDYSAISKSDLASCLGTSEDNIAFLDQNGADGSFNSDPYMGFAFKLTTTAGFRPAGWYESMVGTGTLIDTTAPTVTIVVADTTLNAGETSLVTFTFSEACPSSNDLEHPR